MPQIGVFWHSPRPAAIDKIYLEEGFVTAQERAKSLSTIDEARRLIERSRILCATAADLTRESKAINISIQKSLKRKRKVLRSN